MKQYIPLIVLSALCLIGVAFLIQFGVGPKAVRLIGLSPFDDANHVVSAINHRLTEQMKPSVWIIGIDPNSPDSLDVAIALVERMARSSKGSTQLFRDVRLDSIASSTDLLKIQGYQAAQLNKELLQSLPTSKEKIVFLTAHANARSAIANSFANEMTKLKIPFFSLIFSIFPRSSEEEARLMATLPCTRDDDDRLGTGELGCEVVSIARLNYRKKINNQGNKPLIGLASQIGTSDILFLLRRL